MVIVLIIVHFISSIIVINSSSGQILKVKTACAPVLTETLPVPWQFSW